MTQKASDLPNIALFELADPVKPHITQTLPFCDVAHRALVSISDGLPVFTGCDSERRPLKGHGHSFLLPIPEPGSQRIDALCVFARMGFGAGARRALQKLRAVSGYTETDLRLELSFLGFSEDPDLPPACARLVSPSQQWSSRTPFFATRHIKRTRAGEPKHDQRGRVVGSPLHDLIRLFGDAGLPEVVEVDPLEAERVYGRAIGWSDFVHRRRGGGRRAPHPGLGFRVRFSSPVSGPYSVGFGAHLGLGQFAPH